LSKDYQSYRVDAGIELDCNIKEIPEKFEEAKKLVEEQLTLAIEENKTVLGDLAEAVNK
jgi:hypothetical protein